MNARTFSLGQHHAVEILADAVVIRTTQDVLDLIGETHADYLVLHEHHLAHDFFDVRTGKLGEALQKFTTYRVKVAIIGDFERYVSKALHDLIAESNRRGAYLFLPSTDDALKRWMR